MLLNLDLINNMGVIRGGRGTSENNGFPAAGLRPWSQEVEKPRSIFKRHIPFANRGSRCISLPSLARH